MKSPASSSAGTPQAGSGKCKALEPAGLRSTPSLAFCTCTVTSDDSACTAKVVHEKMMVEGHARNVPCISIQKQSQKGEGRAHKFNQLDLTR